MTVTHTLTFAARCPVDNRQDVYECVIETQRTVKVEDIWAAVMRHVDKPAFQEDLTMRLALDLACKVTLTGLHSNVRTVSTEGGE